MTEVRKGQVREISVIGETVLVLGDNSGMIPLVSLTEKLELAKVRDYHLPLIRIGGRVVAPLPFWNYISPELLERVSQVISEIPEEDLREIGRYLMEVPLEERRHSPEAWEFIRGSAKRWRKFLLHAIEGLYQAQKESPP